MNRAANLRGRAPVSKVYVLYTEEYLRRVELRRNGLADVIQPANLGADPISTIKTALTSRFGGYTADFAVAHARPYRVQYKAWIRLINLPFEIWSVARVAALVSGFGRFIKADDVTKAMTDFRTFRCQIALDLINSIPQNLLVIVGEERFPVMVHLERWERIEKGGDGAPPAPPRNGDGNAAERAGMRDHGRREERGEAQGDEEMEDAPGEVEEAEPSPPSNRASRVRPTTRIPSAAYHFGPAAPRCAAVGRIRWVAMGLRSSHFEAGECPIRGGLKSAGLPRIARKRKLV
uniref:DUF4283 domain-containing protein n=1 Tax=Ananas comosus var. bracteatus TaxID=296719 RepID=A0A6V7PZ98_ANACO|nr:unnamed protein product [Ananas comosus var. bracteatus]